MPKKMRPMSDRKFLSNINREYVVQEITQTETLTRILERLFKAFSTTAARPPTPIVRPNLDDEKPARCPICDSYFTLSIQFLGRRCIKPSHWQASGVITVKDYYIMAKIKAEAGQELLSRHKKDFPADDNSLTVQFTDEAQSAKTSGVPPK